MFTRSLSFCGVFLILGSCFLVRPAQADPGIPPDWQTAVGKGVASLESAELFEGGVVGYLQNGASALWSYGSVDASHADLAPDQNSIFEIGSVSKAFTGILP
jgi:CubicO group peptidase (beta-lactamase class C family)